MSKLKIVFVSIIVLFNSVLANDALFFQEFPSESFVSRCTSTDDLQLCDSIEVSAPCNDFEFSNYYGTTKNAGNF